MSVQLIQMKKSRKKPCTGDIFVVQPFPDKYYYGKVIQTDLQSTDSFINGMFLIYIYDYCSTDKKIENNLDKNKLLIAPMIVNKQPWLKGYFETIGNVAVTDDEKNIDFGFWHILKKEFLDINGHSLDSEPQYHSIFGLGSYGAIAKEIYKVLDGIVLFS